MFELLKYSWTVNICVSALSLLLLLVLKFPMWSFKDLLKVTYTLLAFSFLVPFFKFPSTQNFLKSSQREWSAVEGLSVSPSSVVSRLTPDLDLSSHYLLYILCLGFLCVLLKFVYESMQLRIILKKALLLRSVKSVRLLICSEVGVPFSMWLPFRTYVVLPDSFLANAEHMRLAIAHEIQHHRQRDTKWVYALQVLKCLCFWNPFFYVLERKLSELQEFACDEALIGHRSHSSFAYCRCLLWVAENLQFRRQLGASLGMTSGSAKNVLHRRIDFMLTPKSKYLGRSFLILFAFLALSGILGVAYASQVPDRRVSWEEAEAMLPKDSDFPVVVNDLVLEQLNRYLGSPEGREYIKNSLQQMQNHKEHVLAALNKYHLPHELLAVPIVESGYRNLPQRGGFLGAGIWMFIQSTARNFGLLVNEEIDERLDIAKETDAAMRLLSALHLQFQDWGLALLAFNAGAEAVQRGIEATGSRDVWQLIRNGYEGDKGYLAQLMASVLIVRNANSF